MKYYFIIFSSLLFTTHHVNASLATDNSNNYIGGSGIMVTIKEQVLNPGLLLKAPDLENTLVGQAWVVSLGLYANDSFYVAAEEFNQSLVAGQTFQMTLYATANINGNIGLILFNHLLI